MWYETLNMWYVPWQYQLRIQNEILELNNPRVLQRQVPVQNNGPANSSRMLYTRTGRSTCLCQSSWSSGSIRRMQCLYWQACPVRNIGSKWYLFNEDGGPMHCLETPYLGYKMAKAITDSVLLAHCESFERPQLDVIACSPDIDSPCWHRRS